MRKLGMRITPQKLEVIELLKNNNAHPTIDEIYEHVKSSYENVSKKTIYSIVKSLEAADLVSVVEISDGLYRVDPNTSAHDHFICNDCGVILDSDKTQTKVKPLINTQNFGLTVESIEILYRGVCNSCTRNKRKNERMAHATT